MFRLEKLQLCQHFRVQVPRSALQHGGDHQSKDLTQTAGASHSKVKKEVKVCFVFVVLCRHQKSLVLLAGITP